MKIAQNRLLAGQGFNRILLAFIFAVIYLCGNVLAAPTTYATGVPGGNISDPVVRAVDIAKPAIVRILTTLTGRLTVQFPTTTGTAISATFPQYGAYKLQYLGSGAFISAHGDILTAGHVIRPPRDATNESLYKMAAQDVANYVNNLDPTMHLTVAGAFTLLSDGSWRSQSEYDTPTSRVHLSTDFTGPMSVTLLNGMPEGTYADVDKILKESEFQKLDMAIVHVNMDDTPSIELGDSTNVAQQDELTIIGFPGNGDILSESDGIVTHKDDPSMGFLTSSVNRVYVSALKKNGSGAPLIQVGGNVERGDSGGPALDRDGNIVGIVSFAGTDIPAGTSFLQTSQSAQQLVKELNLNTRPGPFQSAWSKAFAQYSSTEPGHWRLAQQQMQKLQNDYPKFQAIQPFLDYASAQASKEKMSPSIISKVSADSLFWVLIALLILVVVSVLVFLLFLTQRKKRRKAALVTQATASNSPVQSGMLPVVPNQPPMHPGPQPIWHGSAPVYGPPVPYGPQPMPVQEMPNPPYPPGQQQYVSYSQTPATPWPPVPANMPLPPAVASHASQRPVQPGESIQSGQLSSGLIPPQPRQVPAPPSQDAPVTSGEPTAKASQRSTSTSGEIAKPAEDDDDTASAIPVLSEDQVEIKAGDY